MISWSTVIKCLLAFFLGCIFSAYVIFSGLLYTSVGRVNLLNYVVVNEAKDNDWASAEYIFGILHDDIDFYTTYRTFAPDFITAPLDDTFCSSFRISPHKLDKKNYFSLINNKEIESLVTTKASYCFVK